ncbi:hypothetical protein [Rugamonas sp.]|uniref:hypothetical protein n=1 Tax=Rugamonas sp. TaxID=1926287 RepID=UPI0025DFEA3C|nr:hypothetical protein [Rugamonas sp.]
MLDTTTKSLEELGFASNMRKSFSPRKRHVVDMIATICWFHALRIHLDASTVVAVQRAIEPVEIGDPDGVYRRWREYHKGRHSPRRRVIDMCNEVCPQAVAVYRSPLWCALRLDRPIDQVAKSLLGTTCRLGDELIKRMWNFPENSRPHVDPRWMRKRGMAMLRQGNLEGLAVLVVCMRLAASQGLSRLAVTFYRYAAHCMKTLGIWFYALGVAQGLSEYLEDDLLPICGDAAFLGNFSSVHYLSQIQSMGIELKRVVAANNNRLTAIEEVEVVIGWLDL